MRYLIAYRERTGDIRKLDAGVTSGPDLQELLIDQKVLANSALQLTKIAIHRPILGLVICDINQKAA